MAENAIYIPQDSDFVPASEDHKKLTSSEAVTGSKNDMRKRFFAQKSAVAGMVILILLTFLALIGPYLTTHSYDDQQLERANLPPRAPVLSSWGIMDGSETINKTDGRVTVNRYEELGIMDEYYIFGTDNLGRDMFARAFMGLRVSLIIALAATVINRFYATESEKMHFLEGSSFTADKNEYCPVPFGQISASNGHYEQNCGAW